MSCCPPDYRLTDCTLSNHCLHTQSLTECICSPESAMALRCFPLTSYSYITKCATGFMAGQPPNDWQPARCCALITRWCASKIFPDQALQLLMELWNAESTARAHRPGPHSACTVPIPLLTRYSLTIPHSICRNLAHALCHMRSAALSLVQSVCCALLTSHSRYRSDTV